MDASKNGIVIGVVSNLEDPEKLGRVKVRFPGWEDEESEWARVVSLMAGKGRGTFFRPEVGDEVLVAFELGDPRRPYVLGALWSKTDQPPPDDGRAKENNWRFIRSRSGHVIKLDDTKGKEKIEIADKSGSLRIVIDTAGKKVQIEGANVEVKGKTSVKVEAPTVDLKAQGAMHIDGGGMLTLKGGIIKIN